MNVGRLLVSLGLDADEYHRGLDQAVAKSKSSAANIGQSLQQVGGSIQNAGMKMTAFATLPIAGFFAKTTTDASDLEETINKVNVVFEESAPAVMKMGDTAATALGMTREQALAAAGTYGNLFTAMGLTEEMGADMSIGLVQLAADLASFNNMDPTEVLDALRSGLSGETEPLKRLGVNLNQATLEAKAMEMGLIDLSYSTTDILDANMKVAEAEREWNKVREESGAHSEKAIKAQVAYEKALKAQEKAMAGNAGEMTVAAKAQATYALIMDMTTKAQGDFVRTSDGLANSQRILKAKLGDVSAHLGQQLLPIALKLVTFLNELVARFTAIPEPVQGVIMIVLAVVAAIGPLLMVVGGLISALGTIIPIIAAVGGALMGPLGIAILLIVGLVALLAAAWKNNWGGIRDKITEIWEGKLKPAFNALRAWLQENLPKAIAWLKQKWDELYNNALVPLWRWLSATFGPFLRGLADFLSATLSVAVRALAGLWQNVLWPALQKIWSYLKSNVLPVLKDLWNWLSVKLRPAFDALSWAIQSVGRWLSDIATKIKGLKLPWWLTPKSPTPFEMGLRGIATALRDLSHERLPQFQAELALTPVGMDSVMAIRGQRSTVVNFTYRPFISTADEFEADTVLRPIIERTVRRI